MTIKLRIKIKKPKVYNVAEQLKAEPVVKEKPPMKMEDASRINDADVHLTTDLLTFYFYHIPEARSSIQTSHSQLRDQWLMLRSTHLIRKR